MGHSAGSEYWFLCRGPWPDNIRTDKDEKGADFSSKMTTLELVGLMLPFLTIPEVVRGRHVILGVDNVSVVHAWDNKNVTGDINALASVRALLVVTSFLECKVYARHVKRETTEASHLADSFTRKSTTTADTWAAVQGALVKDPPEALWDWLRAPTADWQLGFKLVNVIKNKKNQK